MINYLDLIELSDTFEDDMHQLDVQTRWKEPTECFWFKSIFLILDNNSKAAQEELLVDVLEHWLIKS